MTKGTSPKNYITCQIRQGFDKHDIISQVQLVNVVHFDQLCCSGNNIFGAFFRFLSTGII